MARRVTWTNNSTDYDGTNIYRDTTIDPQNLPEPIATVDPVAQGATVEYIDLTGSGDQCYAVRDFDSSGDGALSDAYCFEEAVSAAWWRVVVDATQDPGSVYTRIFEVEFRESAGVAQSSTGGTAVASSSIDSSTNASKAFDGDRDTTWGSDQPRPQWVGYEHTSSRSVVELALSSSNSFSATLNSMPADFRLQYSGDGTSWTTALTVTGEPAWSLGETRTYAVPV